MANLINTVIVLFLLFNDIFLFSQTLVPFQRTFTTKDGLSHNNIECIGQDKFGFLWIGTFDGLCRYDGFDFKKYYSDPNDSSSLPYSHVNDLAIDKDNNIWIVGRILSRFDRLTDSFVRFDQKDKRKISIDNVSCIETDTAGNLIILCKNGFYLYNSSIDCFLEIPVLDMKGRKMLIPTDSVYFVIDRNNSFWLINKRADMTFQFKYRKNLHNSSQLSICLKNLYKSEIKFSQNPGFANHYWVYQTTNDKVWFMSNEGLFVKPKNTDLIRQANEKEIKIIEFLSFKSIWWSSKPEGLNIIIPQSNQQINIPSTNIYLAQTMFYDKDGNFWCGSLDSKETGDGLHQFIFHFPGFTYYPNQSSEEFRNLAVFSIFRNDKKEIFLGVKNFPYIIKINTNGKIEKTNPVIRKPWNTIFHPRSFLIDDDNRLLVGYLSKILRWNDPTTKKFNDINLKPEFYFHDALWPSFRFLANAGNGKILTGGFGSLMLFDPASLLVTAFKKVPDDVYSELTDNKNHFILGGTGTLWIYDNKLNPIDTIRIGGVGFNIESICEDDSNHLWLGLLMGGLCRLNLQNHQTEFFTVRNGLGNNTIYNILKDHTGKLWISTDAGISVFNPKTKKFFNYDESNGLYIREFNSDAAFQGKDGEMIFGGMGGAVGFYPEQMEQKNKQHSTRIIITAIESKAGKTNTIQSVYEKEMLRFPRGTKNLQVNFSYIDFQNQEKTYFRYRLVGLNDNWVELKGRTRTINLMELNPGNFSLELQTTDPDGNWNKSVRCSIIIPPFYYETLWFKIVAGLMLAIVIGIFIYMRIRQLRLQQDHRMTQLKLSTLQGQINPHFLSNSLAAAESFIGSKDALKANQYLGELRDMMRDLIDYTGKEYILMQEEINFLNRYLKAEQMRTDDLFDYEILAENTDTSNLLLAPSMIQPFVENAIKHAFRGLEEKKGHLKIIFLQDSSDYITCVIEDNGIGQKKSVQFKNLTKGKSKGIELITDRLNIFNKINKTRLKLTREEISPGEKYPGTQIMIQIPCKFMT